MSKIVLGNIYIKKKRIAMEANRVAKKTRRREEEPPDEGGPGLLLLWMQVLNHFLLKML